MTRRVQSRLPSSPSCLLQDYHHQLSLILDVLGTPSVRAHPFQTPRNEALGRVEPTADLPFLLQMEDFYEITSARSKDYLRALPFRKKQDLQVLCPKANPLAVDLMRRCLT